MSCKSMFWYDKLCDNPLWQLRSFLKSGFLARRGDMSSFWDIKTYIYIYYMVIMVRALKISDARYGFCSLKRGIYLL